MNFDEVYQRLEYLENEIIYLKAQHRLQDVLSCKLTENVEEHDEKLNSLLLKMNKLDLSIDLAKNFDENFKENEEDENCLC